MLCLAIALTSHGHACRPICACYVELCWVVLCLNIVLTSHGHACRPYVRVMLSYVELYYVWT